MTAPVNVGAIAALSVFLAWIGWFSVGAVVLNAARLMLAGPGTEKGHLSRQLMTWAGIAAVTLLAGSLLPSGWTGPKAEGIQIPLVYPSLPYTGWFAVIGVFMAIARLIQAFTGVHREAAEFRKPLGWLAFAGVSLLLFFKTVQIGWPWIGVLLIVLGFTLRREEHVKPWISYALWGLGGVMTLAGIGGLKIGFEPSDNKVEFFRGTITMEPGRVIGLACLAVFAFFAMAFLERSRRSRQVLTGFATYATLFVGSVIFAVPFAWLMVTSFKEDKDIVSAEKLEWTPYVYVKGSYMDPKERHFEAGFEGRTVDAILQPGSTKEKLELEVYTPYALRGRTFSVAASEAKEVPREVAVVTSTYQGQAVEGLVTMEENDGTRHIQITTPDSLKGQEFKALKKDAPDKRVVGAKTRNYKDALDYLPPETQRGLLYVKNTLFLVLMSVIGTVLSSTVVGYAFARLRFPGKGFLFNLLMSTMMLPAAVTMLPSFLIWKNLGAYDSLVPLWVPSFFAGAFNVFLIQQFFKTIPMELEEAAKIDGCSYWQTLMRVMVPQIKPVLAAITVFTVKGVWDNFMGPLIYINTPEKMPISYAVQLFQGDRQTEFGLLMAFSTMATVPMIILFFLAQRYFIEGVTLSGLGGR